VKKKNIYVVAHVLMSALLLTACGGDNSDGSNNDVIDTFSISGSLNGLSAGTSLTLQNNGADDLTLTANGDFDFATALNDGSPYSVTVLTQPDPAANLQCSVSNASGTLSGANVSNVSVTCVTTTFSVSGSLTGLGAGASLTLQNNGADDLTLMANGDFDFATALTDGSPYSVTVLTQPDPAANLQCSVSNASGVLSGANVSDVSVTCVPTFSVSGSLTGLGTGASLTLQNNAADDLTLTNNGDFDFTTALTDGSSYSVTVFMQPDQANLQCSVSNEFGLLSGANVSDVIARCTNPLAAGVFIDPPMATNNTLSIALADIDGDGDLDLVAGNSGQANRVYVNNGSGNFIDSGQMLGANRTNSVALADIDGDGDLDLVAGNSNGQPNRIYLNQTNP